MQEMKGVLLCVVPVGSSQSDAEYQGCPFRQLKQSHLAPSCENGRPVLLKTNRRSSRDHESRQSNEETNVDQAGCDEPEDRVEEGQDSQEEADGNSAKQ